MVTVTLNFDCRNFIFDVSANDSYDARNPIEENQNVLQDNACQFDRSTLSPFFLTYSAVPPTFVTTIRARSCNCKVTPKYEDICKLCDCLRLYSALLKTEA